MISTKKITSESNEIVLHPAHFSHCINLVDNYLKSSPYNNTCIELFIKQASLCSFSLPESIKESLMDFKMNGNQHGYLLIRALPTDKNLMDTPSELCEVAAKKTTFYSEFWLAMMGGFLGEPFSYLQENKGNLFHNVRPTPYNHDKLSSESSSILLDFHTETAFHPLAPDYLLLYCLRGDRDQQAKTIVTSIGRFYSDIDPELEKILRQPLFKTGIDYSFGSQNGMRGNGPTIPILYGDVNNPLIIYDPDLMLGLTHEAQNAMHSLNGIINKYKDGCVLDTGDLLIIDNKRALHGRTQFKPYFDGKDRWLQRLYVSRDLRRANMLFSKSERIITYNFNNENNNILGKVNNF